MNCPVEQYGDLKIQLEILFLYDKISLFHKSIDTTGIWNFILTSHAEMTPDLPYVV